MMWLFRISLSIVLLLNAFHLPAKATTSYPKDTTHQLVNKTIEELNAVTNWINWHAEWSLQANRFFDINIYRKPIKTKAIDSLANLYDESTLPDISKQLHHIADLIPEILKAGKETTALYEQSVSTRQIAPELNAYMRKFYTLRKGYHEKLEIIHQKIVSTYGPTPGNTPWHIAGNKMTDLLSICREAANTQQHGTLIDIERIDALKQLQNDYETNRDVHLKGLQPMPHFRGNNPFNTHKHFGLRIYSSISILGNREESQNYRVVKSIDHLNQAIDHYNEFCDMASGELYQRVQDEYRPIYLIKALYLPIYEYIAPLPKIEAKAEKQSPVVAKNQKPTHSTDTVYVRDTVYLNQKDKSLFSNAATNNLVFLIDVSASMKDDDNLELVKRALLNLARQLRSQDEIAIVTFSGKARKVLPVTTATNLKAIEKALKKLKSKGNTNLTDGLSLAYQTLQANYQPNGNNHIILATDGVLNLSKQSEDLFKNIPADYPIDFTVLALGQVNEYTADRLKRIAQIANGNYQGADIYSINTILTDLARKVSY